MAVAQRDTMGATRPHQRGAPRLLDEVTETGPPGVLRDVAVVSILQETHSVDRDDLGSDRLAQAHRPAQGLLRSTGSVNATTMRVPSMAPASPAHGGDARVEDPHAVTRPAGYVVDGLDP
jgi:hypothetical protein